MNSKQSDLFASNLSIEVLPSGKKDWVEAQLWLGDTQVGQIAANGKNWRAIREQLSLSQALHTLIDPLVPRLEEYIETNCSESGYCKLCGEDLEDLTLGHTPDCPLNLALERLRAAKALLAQVDRVNFKER